MQLSLTTATDQKYFWAFARDNNPPGKRYRLTTQPHSNLGRYIITSCSKQAKAYGVKMGMTYREAVKLIPGIRVIICNR
jgi:nucleotidyltransferase/DNA polymerase involved in DNA repair